MARTMRKLVIASALAISCLEYKFHAHVFLVCFVAVNIKGELEKQALGGQLILMETNTGYIFEQRTIYLIKWFVYSCFFEQ